MSFRGFKILAVDTKQGEYSPHDERGCIFVTVRFTVKDSFLEDGYNAHTLSSIINETVTVNGARSQELWNLYYEGLRSNLGDKESVPETALEGEPFDPARIYFWHEEGYPTREEAFTSIVTEQPYIQAFELRRNKASTQYKWHEVFTAHPATEGLIARLRELQEMKMDSAWDEMWRFSEFVKTLQAFSFFWD